MPEQLHHYQPPRASQLWLNRTALIERLDSYYRLVNAVIISRQHPCTGILLFFIFFLIFIFFFFTFF
jgi:hypothetical protein